ncbi:hypothetical protein GCK72_005930 [Caenorhabditis remanei]|uniref:RNase H type-1 domain-containing protein n=2 Tax=Caenorhabditis remanei TaxID=31234 RepID=E3M4C1_CAERE|nr:hypothetical protein GCK72_005930 [Caenorhabditis remanei]EFO91551.1 hypothetical protein CRE_11730 [Caenorhabditis remanei]KAF1765976.1 hypothetical protein GCK72_005930 [Caenorhabditis remanei]
MNRRYYQPRYVEDIRVYTDGCALRNGRSDAKGGWAVVFQNDRLFNATGFSEYGPQTNNRYELKAIEEALKIVLRDGPAYNVTIVTDSHYAINSITMWRNNWIQNGWRTSNGTPVANKELIETIYSMIGDMQQIGGSVRFEYVVAHSGDWLNDRADRMAKDAADQNPLVPY